MSESREGRDGDSQPMPIARAGPDIQSQVIADIEDRRILGIRRYGTALQAHNGRNALQDAYEEALDLAMYLKQALVEFGDEANTRVNEMAHSLAHAQKLARSWERRYHELMQAHWDEQATP